MRTRILAALGGVFVATGMSACSLVGATEPTTPAAAPATASAGAEAGQGAAAPIAKPQVLRTAQIEGFGSAVVVNGKGRTIYRFNKDSNNPPETNCVDECLRTWEPVLAPNGVQVEAGIEEDLVGSITRPDGTEQLTLNGWPMYYFHRDLELGQTAGHGMNGAWFAISPRGARVKREGGSAPAAKPQVLRVVQLDGFSPAVVVNGKGRTIYRFENDSNNPPRTRCVGECLEKWEPVLAPNGVQVEAGIDEGLVGSITRPDGTRQLTLKGWPLYYFHKDVKLGQTAGHGVNDAWFAISPGGGKTNRT